MYIWLSWLVYTTVAHLVNNYLILYSYFLWNNPTDLLPLLVMHVCVCPSSVCVYQCEVSATTKGEVPYHQQWTGSLSFFFHPKA